MSDHELEFEFSNHRFVLQLAFDHPPVRPVLLESYEDNEGLLPFLFMFMLTRAVLENPEDFAGVLRDMESCCARKVNDSLQGLIDVGFLYSLIPRSEMEQAFGDLPLPLLRHRWELLYKGGGFIWLEG